MRFHRIKLRNLNSLYGDHTIDFDTDMRDAPMFLIMGPTGAGKSTVLDAICLALFGQTPRLDRKTGRPETDVSHILSQGTAESSAEIEFSVKDDDGNPERFLAVWSCRRAYDDPEGAVQKPERSLYRFRGNGEMQLVVSDHREKFFQPYFDDVLANLTVHDFQRTILLAQGEFSAFLNAASKEKATILERLTNTDLYRQIGSRASKKKRDTESQLKALDQTLAELTGTEPIDEKALRKSLEQDETRVLAITDTVGQRRADRDWLNRAQQLESDLERAALGLTSAKKSQEEQKDLFEKRDGDLKVREAEAPLLLIRNAESTLAELTATLPEVETTLTELETRVKSLTESNKATDESLASASQSFSEIQPDLERAAELHTKLAAAESELASSEERLRTLSDAVSLQEKTVESVTRDHEALSRAQGKLTDAWNELGKRREILEIFPDLIATYEHAVAPISDELQKIHALVDEISKKIEATDSEITPLSEQLQVASKSRASQQAAVTRVENEISTDGVGDLDDEINQLRFRLDGSLDAMKSLGEASLLLDRIIAAEAEREKVRDQLTLIESELKELVETQSQAKEIEAAHLESVRACEEAVRLNERLRALSELRTQLEHGEPCPLCGSPLHPFSASDQLQEHEQRHVEEHERLLENRDKAKEKLQAANENVQRSAAKYVSRMTAKQHDESQLISINERLEQDQKVFAHALERAGFNPLEAFELKKQTKLARLAEERETDITSLREKLEKLNDFRSRLTKSRTKLSAAQAEQDRLSGELKKFESTRSALEKDRSRHLAEQDALASKRRGALAEIEERVTALSFEFDPNELDIPATLSAFREEVAAVQTERESLNEKEIEAKKRREEATLKFQAAAENESAEKANVEARRATRDSLRQSTSSLLDGKNPNDVRRELESRLAEIRKTLDDARKELSACDAQRQKTQERKAQIGSQIDRTKKRIKSAEDDLEKRLGELGVDRQDIESKLLPPEERSDIETACAAIEREIAEHQTRVKTLNEQIDAHKTSRTPVEKTVEEIVDELQEAETRLSEATKTLGATQEKWRRYQTTLARETDLRTQRETLAKEAELWSTIYRVIGVGDGQRFQEFAQSLNLRGLVERANVRLEHLYPRYHIAVAESEDGSPTMDFIVQDRYQANSERPLTTLSGGETFLVSLALALALADYRKVSMPIETLLLDEGFGTLDEDALHMALTTLHQLHRDGARQIGIISHVASLKELVDSRIVIEPRGHGRSEIRFEFGSSDPDAQIL